MATESEQLRQEMETPSKSEYPLFVPDNPELTEMVQLQQEESQQRASAFYGEESQEKIDWYPDVKTYTPPANMEEIAAQAAYVETMLSGGDFDEAFSRHRSTLSTNTPKETQSILNRELETAYKTDTEQAIIEAISAGDTATAIEAVNYLNSTSTVPFEHNFVALTGTNAVSPVEQQRLADNLRVYNRLNEIISSVQEKVTGWDIAGSIVNSIIPGHANRVFNEMAERVLEKEIDWDSVADIDIINDLRDRFLSLNVDERLDFLDNMVQAAEIESGLFDENYQEVLDVFLKFQEAASVDVTSENAWAAIDVAGLGLPALTRGTIKGLIKTHAILKNSSSTAATVAKAGNTKLASQAIATDILENTAVSGLSKGEQVSKAFSFGENPLTMEGAVLSGASDEVKQALRDFAIKREVQQIIAEKGHTGLSAEDVQGIVTKWEEAYKFGATPHIKSQVLREADDTGATFDVLIKNPEKEGGFISERSAHAFAKDKGITNYELEEVIEGPWKAWYIKGEYHRPFALEDVQAIKTEGTGLLTNVLHNWLAFPAQTLNFDRIATAAINVHKEATLRNNFSRLWKDAFKGVKGKSKTKVINALQKGDVEKKVFSENELAELGLNQKEIISYYKVRTIRDVSYMAHDKAIVDNLTFKGFNKVAIQGTDEIPSFETAGKTYSIDEAKEWYKSGETTALDISTGGVTTLTKETLEQIYKDGGVITRIAHPEDMRGITHDIIITKAEDVTHSPLTTALPYRVGEIARSYVDDWFVYIPKKGYRNGRKTTYNTTVRTAPSHADATKWVGAHNAALHTIRQAEKEGLEGITKEANPELYRQSLVRQVDESLAEYGDSGSFVDSVLSGEIDITQKFGVKFDREVPHGVAQGEQIEAMFAQGKLFSGQRSEHLLNVYGDKAPIKSVQESLANEMSYVSKFTSLATWRETQLDQILKTFDSALPEGVSKYERALISEPHPGSLTTREQKYLERLRQHVKTRIGIPTDEALKSKEKLIEFSKNLEGTGFTKAAGWVRGFKDTTPAQAFRTAVFHSYLGLFNLQQFIVQANGAAIAASIHPIHGLKAGFSYPVIRTAMLFDSVGNKTALDAMVKTVDFTTLGMTGKDELLETIDLVKRSGILNDIKSSALYYVKEGAINLEGDDLLYAANIASRFKEGAKKALDAGLQPFQRGEEMARIVALDIARREWKKLNPGKAVNTRQAMNEIVTMQDKYTMGMTKGNMGRIQQGWAAVPFQFAQWNLKFAEGLLGKTFTKSEKARMLTMGSMIYGAEGTAGYLGADWILSEILGEDVTNQMTAEQKLAYNQGMISWAIDAATGAEVAVGERLGPASYFSDMITAFGGDKTALEMISGAPGSFVAKEAEAFNEVYRIFFESEDAFTYENALEAADTMIRASSSGYNNFTKYYLAMKTDNYLRTKTGKKIAKINTMEAVLGMFGLPSVAALQSIKINANTREVDLLINDLAKDYETMFRKFYAAEDKPARDRIWSQMQVRRHTLKTGDGAAIENRAWRLALKRSQDQRTLLQKGAERIQQPYYSKQAIPKPEELEGRI